MERLFRVIDRGLVDLTLMTTHRLDFDELEHTFELVESKEEGIIQPLIPFT